MADFNAQQLATADDLGAERATPDAVPAQQLWAFNDPANAVAPVVGNFDPPQNTTIGANAPVAFDVTDDEGLFRRIIIHASFPDGTEEVVHDGSSFRGYYQAGSSSRVIIAGGYRFTLLRAGGWPGNPTIRAFAIDEAGNEATA